MLGLGREDTTIVQMTANVEMTQLRNLKLEEPHELPLMECCEDERGKQ